MLNLHKYIIAGLSIIIVFIYIGYHNVSEKYEELTKDYIRLESQYNVEKSNTVSLENAIKSQNLIIEQYKQASADYENKIEEMNKTIEKYNETPLTYEKINNSTSSEEAILWLREKASSLSQ